MAQQTDTLLPGLAERGLGFLEPSLHLRCSWKKNTRGNVSALISGGGGEGGPFDLSIDSRAADGVDVAAAMIKLVVSRCNSSSSNHEQDALSDRPGCTTKLHCYPIAKTCMGSDRAHVVIGVLYTTWTGCNDNNNNERKINVEEEKREKGKTMRGTYFNKYDRYG